MKEQLILWIGSAVITFLVLYLGNISGHYYPVSGTIGIEGQKVTYQFDKIYRGNKAKEIIIRKDIKDAQSFLSWKVINSKPGSREDSLLKTHSYNKIAMKDSGEVFKTYLPLQQPMTHILYKAEVLKNNVTYPLPPAHHDVDMVFIGSVPSSIMGLYYFFLYGGIFLSVRGALEYFNKNKKLKVYGMFTAIFFFCYTVAVTPLKMSYELGAIGHSVPSFEQLFNIQAILLFLTWTIGMAMIIGSRKPGIRGIIFSVITILIFLFFPVTY